MEALKQCNREEPNLTTCWNCFFYFNLCFPLLLFTKRILSIRNGLPWGTLSLSLNVKPKCLWSGKHPDPVHPVDGCKKEEINISPPWGWPFQGIFTKLLAFLLPHLLPLCAIKETGIQSPIRWLFWDFSLPSSWSAGLPNKVIFLASKPRLRFIGLSCGKQSELGLGNISIVERGGLYRAGSSPSFNQKCPLSLPQPRLPPRTTRKYSSTWVSPSIYFTKSPYIPVEILKLSILGYLPDVFTPVHNV